jgi:hypothetical protein
MRSFTFLSGNKLDSYIFSHHIGTILMEMESEI